MPFPNYSIRHLQQFLKRGLKPLFYRFKIIVSGDVYCSTAGAYAQRNPDWDDI